MSDDVKNDVTEEVTEEATEGTASEGLTEDQQNELIQRYIYDIDRMAVSTTVMFLLKQHVRDCVGFDEDNGNGDYPTFHETVEELLTDLDRFLSARIVRGQFINDQDKGLFVHLARNSMQNMRSNMFDMGGVALPEKDGAPSDESDNDKDSE